MYVYIPSLLALLLTVICFYFIVFASLIHFVVIPDYPFVLIHVIKFRISAHSVDCCIQSFIQFFDQN